MHTCSMRKEPTSPYLESERFIHRTKKKNKKRTPFIPIENTIPKIKYPPFENLFETEVIYNPFLDIPLPMANDRPMRGNNRAIAPTLGAAIVSVDLEDNFTIKGHHLFMIKDRQFYMHRPIRINASPNLLKFAECSDMAIPIGKTYDPPVNPNDKTTIIDDDIEDEADEAEKKEGETSSSKQTKSDPPLLKVYKPKIPYP
ncbi:hypothetical protein Tco_1494097 [Tanacetum coccineum]